MIKKLQIKFFFYRFTAFGDAFANGKYTWLRPKLSIGLAILFIGGFILAGCNGSKGLAKKGGKLQEAGLYSDAALFYYNSLLKNNNNVDARIGLTSTGQRVLNDKLAEFSRAKTIDDHKKAVYSYLDALAYREKIERLGISLTAPDYLADDFKEAKSVYLKRLYNRGNDLMAEKKFDEANSVFSELTRLEPNYKDVKELKNVSQNEPIYLGATTLFDNREYRKAYYEFDGIYNRDPNYKDVSILRSECLDKGQYPVAVVPFDNASGKRDIEKRVQAFVLTDLASINDPFLKIIERENMEMILQEQRLSLSGVVNEQTAAQVGNLLGAKAIITGTVLSYSQKPGRMVIRDKEAYEGYQVKLYNKEEDRNYYETRYKAVSYKEYYNTNEVSISFQYKAISLESGEVLFSKVVNKNLDSQVYYGVYPGEIKSLYPAGKDGVITASRDRNQLISLMRASREIKSVEQLSNEAYAAVANALSQDLINQINKL
ncbi:hypothetical protein G3O08_18230 [Cryomorpha ignava]|uniref:Tetratricopeptide repeat protein n=1 Tax=Cryomorpha ignava TaxID=101383 RepID=A0A7K3WX53_9FLAO|nr:CsgG/HfaB family protein [Cryomorpha ignava]NEN25432.1 hypothetical protein [Cryomorpha ignava]